MSTNPKFVQQILLGYGGFGRFFLGRRLWKFCTQNWPRLSETRRSCASNNITYDHTRTATLNTMSLISFEKHVRFCDVISELSVLAYLPVPWPDLEQGMSCLVLDLRMPTMPSQLDTFQTVSSHFSASHLHWMKRCGIGRNGQC